MNPLCTPNSHKLQCWQGKQQVSDSQLWLTNRTQTAKVYNGKQILLLSRANVLVSNPVHIKKHKNVRFLGVVYTCSSDGISYEEMHSNLAVQRLQNSLVTSVFIYIGYERVSVHLHIPKPKTWTNTIMECNLVCGRLVNLGIQ